MKILIDWMYKIVGDFGEMLMKVLPTSPFRSFIKSFEAPQYLGWLNWFFPVREVLSILTIWLSAIALFYIYSIVMRWIKMIGD